ncbi:hypothetical protein DFQ26_002052, partial [Actinomortierella ambigua]
MDVLEDSSSVPLGHFAELRPFSDFQGWESCIQVRDYRDLVCRSLPSAEARCIFNVRVPRESIPELLARFHGRPGFIVSAI